MISKQTIILVVLLIISISCHFDDKQILFDPNCNVYAENGTCLNCSQKFYKNRESGLCKQVSDLCKTWNQTTGDCLTCYLGYGAPINGRCDNKFGNEELTDENCIEFAVCKKKCKICKPGYYLDTCFKCQLLPEGCLQANPDGTCKCCDKTKYELIDGYCVPLQIDDHCARYQYIHNGNWTSSWKLGCKKVCKVCEKGYYLDTWFKCQLLPEGCLQANPDGTCKCCDKTKYELIDGYCVPLQIDDHCAYYQYIHNGNWTSSWKLGCKKVCKVCEKGYYLDTWFKCQLLPEGCLQANPDGTCKCCDKTKYELIDGYCVPLQIDDHCACYQYIHNGNWTSSWKLGCKKVCKVCEKGYYLDTWFKCQLLPEGCLQANPDGTCKCCDKTKYELIDGYCVPLQIDDHCAYYQYIHNGNWTSSWKLGCKKVCKVCEKGYYLDTWFKCQLLPEGCLQANPDGTCKCCDKTKYELIDGYCVPLQIDDHCAYYQYIHNGNWTSSWKLGCKKVCKVCEKGYYLDTWFKCQLLPEGCLQANPDGTCKCCDKTKYELIDGYCVPLQIDDHCACYQYIHNGNWTSSWKLGCKKVCKVCEKGYYLDTWFKCQLLPEGCLQANPDGTCKCCDKTKYELIDGYCVPLQIDDHCACYQYIHNGNWTSSWKLGCKKVCKVCEKGYYLDTWFKCQLLPEGCLQANPDGTCKCCDKTKYELIDGYCVPLQIDDHCAYYQYIHNGNWTSSWKLGCKKVCKVCEKGYYLDTWFKCQLLPEGCLQANPDGTCKCCDKTKYELIDGYCVPLQIDDHCACYQYIHNGNWTSSWKLGCKKVCKVCEKGYYLDTWFKCQLLPEGCLQANPDGTCKCCDKTKYELIDGYCVPLQIDDHCAYYQYIHNGNWTSSWKLGCKKVCKVCEKGYYLDTWFKCQLLPEGCLQANPDGTCKCCDKTKYELIDGYCVPLQIDDHCACYQYIHNGNWTSSWKLGCKKVCKVCEKGYYLDTWFKCQLLPEGCLQANPDGTCKCCDKTKYELIDGYCVPLQIDDHCAYYQYIHNGNWTSSWKLGCKKVCKVCEKGYYLDTWFKCQLLPEGCLQANPDGTCKCCDKTKYELIDGYCVPLQIDDHCAYYQYIHNGNWTSSWKLGCKKVCKVCEKGYYLDTWFKCQLLPEGCLQANPDGTCKCCDKTKYELIDGYCVLKNNSVCASFNLCSNVNPITLRCTSCVPRSYLDDNYCCAQVNGYCKNWKPNGVCLDCYLGYRVNPFKPKQCILI